MHRRLYGERVSAASGQVGFPLAWHHRAAIPFRMTADRLLLWLVRLNAVILLCALPCALLPFAWMDAIHRDWLGLGSLPELPIIQYMTRSLSLVYAGHGFVALAIALDWTRYRTLVPLLAWLHIGFGLAMVAVDQEAGLAWWWVAVEGPSLIAIGIILLWLYWRAQRGGSAIPSVTNART